MLSCASHVKASPRVTEALNSGIGSSGGQSAVCATPFQGYVVCSRYLDMTPSKEVLHQSTIGSAHASMVDGEPMRQDGLEVGVSALLCLFLHATDAQTSALGTYPMMQEVYKRLQTALQHCSTSQSDAAFEVSRPVVNNGFSNAQHGVCHGADSQLDQASCHASKHLSTCLQSGAQSVTADTD